MQQTMAPTAAASQPRRKRSTAGTNKLVGGKTPSFRPNDSNSSSDDLIQEVVIKPSTQSKVDSTKSGPKKKKKSPPVTPPPVAVTPVSLPPSNSSSSSSSSSAAASSSSSASTSSSESVATSVEESDGGWSSAQNEFSSNHEDDFDDDAEPLVLPPPPPPVKRKVKASSVVEKKEKSVTPLKQKTNADKKKEKNVTPLKQKTNADKKKETNVTPLKQKTKVDKKKKVPRQADAIIDKKGADDTGSILLSEDIDDSILRGSSDHSMDLHSFSDVASQQQQYIVVEEPHHMSYHYDGVHLEEDVSDSQSLHDNNIPSSVAINVDNGSQQQQMNNSGNNPLFDVSDTSMDDSISKNYDSRYDGSLQDLTYNHGKSNGSINNFSGGSWNQKNENQKCNTNSKGEHDDDDDDGSDSSSEMDELTGYLSSGDLHNPNVLLQPFVGERPPTPPSPMRSMNGKQHKGKPSSPIKSTTAKTGVSPSKDLPRITKNNHDDLVGSVDLKDESTASESAPPSYRNTQFDNFYPPEYGTHNDGDIGNASNDKLMDTSVQPSCKYNSDEELGDFGNTRRFDNGNDNEKDRESATTPKDDDREKKQQRMIRMLFVALACACLALLAMGVVVGLLMKNDKEPEVAISSTPSPAAIVSAPTPTQSVTTSPSVSPSIVLGVTTAAPILPPVALPTNAPILRNSTASLPFAAPTNAPIQRNSTASLPFPTPTVLETPSVAPVLRNTSASVGNSPIAAPTTVGAPVVLTPTESPTIDSIALTPF